MPQSYNFQHADKVVSVFIDKENGHKIRFAESGNVREIEFKGFWIDYKNKSIQVDYVSSLLNSEALALTSAPGYYVNAEKERYDGLYHANSFSEDAGDFYAKQCLSGIARVTLGVELFSATGQFIQTQI